MFFASYYRKSDCNSVDHTFENKVKGDPVENNSFPLSFSSFEWLRKRSKVTNQTQKYEIMDEDIRFLEMDNEKDEQYEQSQHIEKQEICNGGVKHQEEDQGCLSIP